jgi:HTH-type transcriptional regulator/antitoxin HipB
MMSTLQHVAELAEHLRNERQRQHLSREQLAAVSGVSPSFIRDAESRPGACSFGKLLQLVQGLGLTLAVHGTTPAAEVDR